MASAATTRLTMITLPHTATAERRQERPISGAVPVAGTPEQFAELIRSEAAKWAKVVKFAQVQPN